MKPVFGFDLNDNAVALLNAVELQQTGDVVEPPTEFLLLRRGATRMRKGSRVFDVILDARSEELIQAAVEAKGREDLPVDYDHGMLGLISTRESSAAAGWFRLAFRDDGLYATNVQWTRRARLALQEREFRFTSPAIFLEPIDPEDEQSDVRVSEIINVALTNLPATVAQRPLVASENQAMAKKDEEKQCEKPNEAKSRATVEIVNPEEILKLFDAKDESDLRKIAESLSANQDAIKKATIALAESEKAYAELTSANAELAAANAELHAKAKAQAEDASRLAGRVAQLEQIGEQQKFDSVFNAGVASGKLPESLHDWARKQSVSQLEEFLNAMPTVMSGRKEIGKSDSPTAIDDVEAKILRLTGLDKDSYLKTRAALESNESLPDPWTNPVVSTRGYTPYFSGDKS